MHIDAFSMNTLIVNLWKWSKQAAAGNRFELVAKQWPTLGRWPTGGA